MSANSEDMNVQFCGATVSVIGFREDDSWVALALEMDIRGYGDTFEDALQEMVEGIGMQINFATFKEQPDMVFHPAAPAYFSLFAQVRDEFLRAAATSTDTTDMEYQIGGVSIPQPHVIENNKKAFHLANG
ncbi:MAG TPA: hypothetical protein ENI74_09370 [Gammaproteobacteria bacterium]|nr:hypothetical protein [Gammaproteobacteria bacterium]